VKSNSLRAVPPKSVHAGSSEVNRSSTQDMLSMIDKESLVIVLHCWNRQGLCRTIENCYSDT